MESEGAVDGRPAPRSSVGFVGSVGRWARTGQRRPWGVRLRARASSAWRTVTVASAAGSGNVARTTLTTPPFSSSASSPPPPPPPPQTRFRFAPPDAAAAAAASRGADDWVAVPFPERLERLLAAGKLDERRGHVLRQWYETYEAAARQAAADGVLLEYGCASADEDTVRQWCSEHFATLFDILVYQQQHPFHFAPYHRAVRGPPFDYAAFGNLMSRPLCDLKRSHMDAQSAAVFQRIVEQLQAGDNVCLLGNHQSEADPFAIYHMFRHHFGAAGAHLAQSMIYMAGDRVREDPLAAPFSAGRSMLTVYSRKHMNDEPERRAEKQMHNRRTLKEMERLFSQGGQCVWFAPSGGRDRRSPATGRVECAPFDADAIELFRLSAARAARACHYYPMAIGTFVMMPPPDAVERDKGESRVVRYAPLWMSLMPELDWAEVEAAAGNGPAASMSKAEAREARSRYIYERIARQYQQMGAYDAQ